MSSITRLLAAAILCLASGAAIAGEWEERLAISEAARASFLAGRFAELERTRAAYLNSNERTGSGVPKLTVFYDALGSYSYQKTRKDPIAALKAQAMRWARAFPKSTAAAIVLAGAENEAAWKIRGPGFANTVTPAQWRGFATRLAAAAGHLMRVAKTSRDDPRWYASRLTLSLECGEGWTGFAEVAREALERHPTHIEIHHAILRAHLPQWNGSYDAVDRAIEAIVARTAASSGQEFYARAYWWLGDKQLRRSLFKQSKVSWPRMKQGFIDTLSRYATDWNLNIYAKYACYAEDRATLAETMKRLDGRLIETIWDSKDSMEACARVPAQMQREAEDIAHFNVRQPVPDEIIARKAISAATSEDFIAGRFDRLDAAYREFLTTKATTASGFWKLQSFYDGLQPLAMLYEPGARVDQPDFGRLRAQTEAWRAAAPASVSAIVARARLYLTEALQMRYARTPTALSPEDRAKAGFDELAAAKKLLDDHRDVASADPAYWATALLVSNAQRSDAAAFEALAREAFSVEPTYSELFAAIRQRALSPEPMATLRDISRVGMQGLPERRVAEVYGLSVLLLAEGFYVPGLINDAKIDWPLAERGLETIVDRYPSIWNFNGYANLACQARDRRAATEALARINGRFIEGQWSDWRAPKACADWVASTNAEQPKP
ncbi:DUF4034 domain-containing protein [Hansschlegelia quercus]|uniref:DUF4034 domain-containing protein n=1 Tax=Hansschlegelia quercus TaxID=2528245 RepID=A0A4Q9GJU8_9HYPH|nr:DUF4034 domain-containing protein [Hansschlegelia quercus]TBN53355.1 DUF4034 domain-containing protein [Hansschlegelia quercus]